MLDLDDYYLGIIIAHPDYFKNPKRNRFMGKVNFDPFNGKLFEEAIVKGIPTLLRKKNDIYFDEYFSRWKNELGYSLGVANDLGIVLAFVKPFTEYYDQEPVFFIKEDVEEKAQLMEEIFHNYDYYIAHSKLDRSDAIVVVNEDIMYDFHYDYYKYLLEQFNSKEKTK